MIETPDEQVLEEQIQEFMFSVKQYARCRRMNVRQLYAIWNAGVAKTEAEEIEGFCYQIKDYARTHNLTADQMREIFHLGIINGRRVEIT
jgi:hypothetical protein